MNWQTSIERTVTAMGYELVDTERTAGGLLRVFIDKPENERVQESSTPDPAAGFITVDDCEKVTRQLLHVLEVDGCAYSRLEVSSPGLDRPLKRPADYARFAGEQIDLSLRVAFQGRKKYRGVLGAHGDGWRIVFNDGEDDQALDFSIDEVKEARLVPTLDFKGRRFAARPVEPAPATGPHGAQDGDRKQ